MSADKKLYYGSTNDVSLGEIVEVSAPSEPRFALLQITTDSPCSSAFLYNDDLKPVQSTERCWRWYNYVCFWVSDALNVNAWQIASAAVAAGLNWWQAWLSVWVGYFFASFFVVMVARPGTYYHIPFPVTVRSSFGIVGSVWPVINRVMMAIVWFSCQTWIFGQSIQLMVRAVCGNEIVDWVQWAPTLGFSGVNQFEFLCYIAAWVVTLPFIWFPPNSIRHLFTLKSIVVPIAGGLFLVWAVYRALTSPDMSSVAFLTGPTLSGIPPQGSASTLGAQTSRIPWTFIAACMNGVANFAAMIVNSPDFSRFADRPSAPTWSQFLTIPAAFSVTAIVGIIVSTCAARIYGQVYWSPLDILDKFLETNNGQTRLGVFLIAAALGLASIGTNICANSLSAGTDMAALLPRYINIRRGGYICAIIAFSLQPWHFFASSNKFTAYLGSYSTFLSCVAGIMVSDYYIVRRGYLDLVDLYSTQSYSRYMYGRGVNWRAYAAYALGVLPNLPGFLHVFGREIGYWGELIYRFNYFVGFGVSLVSYALLSRLFSVAGARNSGWHEKYEFVDDFDMKMVQNRLV